MWVSAPGDDDKSTISQRREPIYSQTCLHPTPFPKQAVLNILQPAQRQAESLPRPGAVKFQRPAAFSRVDSERFIHLLAVSEARILKMTGSMHQMAAALTVLLVLCGTFSCVSAWRQGRATFYGNEPWYWSIHHGSCGFGYQWPDQGTGWDIAALADTHPDYSGSCGGCYEVRCKGTDINDGFGEAISRGGVCKDEGATVVVETTDTCPCQYQNNYYSNKRWCCGDMEHMDISVWAFQKLTDMKWGVIPIEYRKVDCGYQPSNKASGADFPGEFPPVSEASTRADFDWYKYFPNGGYLNSKAGDGSGMVSTEEYLRRLGQGGSSSYESAQFGKKKGEGNEKQPQISHLLSIY